VDVEEVFKIWFGSLFVMVIIWFALCMKLFKILRNRHPGIYEDMGEPSLLANNTFANNIGLVKYLFKRKWSTLNDSELEKLSNVMLVYWCVYFASFISFIALMFMGYAV